MEDVELRIESIIADGQIDLLRNALASIAACTTDIPAMELMVDARDTLNSSLLKARIVIPVDDRVEETPVLYPQWIPGTHAPAGNVGNLGGLWFMAHGAEEVPLVWRRDRLNRHRFVVSHPRGIQSIVVLLHYIANQPTDVSSGADCIALAGALFIPFNTVLLYPERGDVRRLHVRTTVALPSEWQPACASTLHPLDKEDGAWFTLPPMSCVDLMDEPVFAGPCVVSVPLASEPPAFLHVATADGKPFTPDPKWAQGLARVVDESLEMFGRALFDSYHFFVLSGYKQSGVEHSRCSLTTVPATVAVVPGAGSFWDSTCATHEFVHSWCGKYVCPRGVASGPGCNVPLDTSALWVYEGLTQYLGHVLAVRGGMISFEEWTAQLASVIVNLSSQGGRHWRSIEDTAISTYMLRTESARQQHLRRGQEYYDEGALLWLEVDVILRTAGSSIDVFCRSFFGAPKVYEVEDVIAALLAVDSTTDWVAFVSERVTSVRRILPVSFLDAAGYTLTHTHVPSTFEAELESVSELVNALSSIGCRFHGGWVRAVMAGSSAALAGLHEGLWVSSVEVVDVDKSEEPETSEERATKCTEESTRKSEASTKGSKESTKGEDTEGNDNEVPKAPADVSDEATKGRNGAEGPSTTRVADGDAISESLDATAGESIERPKGKDGVQVDVVKDGVQVDVVKDGVQVDVVKCQDSTPPATPKKKLGPALRAAVMAACAPNASGNIRLICWGGATERKVVLPVNGPMHPHLVKNTSGPFLLDNIASTLRQPS